jgi:hypothetical protein
MVDVRHDDRLWERKTDGDMHVMPPGKQPVQRWYPGSPSEQPGSLDHLLWCIKNIHVTKGPVAEMRATGSHWAMSEASVTPGDMIETATPVHEKFSDQSKPRLNRVLYDVIPDCLTDEARRFFFYGQKVPVFDPSAPVDPTKIYLFHVEAGIRIFELYSYIDGDLEQTIHKSMARQVAHLPGGTPTTPPSTSYYGPWALETMGGAGGQTIAGVISTATHGGDVAAGAIGDLVLALHLIAPNGQEYWIERATLSPTITQLPLVDPQKLVNVYGKGLGKPGGLERINDIIHIRSDALMNAAIVSCGRMGIVYSVVLRTIRQYALDQPCEIRDWAEVKAWLCTPAHPMFASVFGNRFVRIDVDVYPKPEFSWKTVALMVGLGAFTGPPGLLTGLLLGLKGNEYRSWVITRTLMPLSAAQTTNASGQTYIYGRPERAGDMAGKGRALGKEDDSGYFSNPCGTDNVIRAELNRAIDDLEDIRLGAIAIWVAATFSPIPGLGAGAAQGAESVIVFTTYWIVILEGILSVLPAQAKLGDIAAIVMNTLALLGAHSLIQLLYLLVANGEHPDTKQSMRAVSYAIMDEHDYQSIGCKAPGDSIEFFTDANNPQLIGFIDYALNAVRELLEDDHKAFGGYISMRFMTTSPALLATQRWARTCSIEIAGLSRCSGTADLLARLEAESLKRDIILHWGQRNRRVIDDIEKHFSPLPGGALYEWRNLLSLVSEHGRLANFSTDFTRKKGLEITQPRLYAFAAKPTEACADETTTITWDAYKNPPGTSLTLVQRFEDGHQVNRPLPNLRSSDLATPFVIPLGHGRSTLELHATRKLEDRFYGTPPLVEQLRGFATGDTWDFQFQATQRSIGGVMRWFVEVNLFSQFISDKLRVSELTLWSAAGGLWILRNAETGDVNLTSLPTVHAFPGLPVFNRNWQLHSTVPATGAAPFINLRFHLTCV